MAGPLLSVSSDFLFHVSSTLPLSFHYPCCLFVLVPRSSETTGRDALVLLDRFPFPQENGQPTVSPVVVCRVVLSDRRARRQTKEGMLDQRLIRSRKCRREKFLGIPFCFNRSRDVYRFRGRTRFDLGWLEAFYNRRTEESEGWSLEGLFFFFDKGSFYLFCFLELRIVIIFSPERIRLRTMHTGRKERLSRLRYYSE